MKKVLIVGDFITGSGLTQVIFNVFGQFSPEKYKIEVVGYGSDPEKRTDKKCKKLGWTIYRVIPVTKSPIKHWKWWKQFFKTHSYDITYFNYSSSWNYLPLVYAKRYGNVKEIICHSHNSYFSHKFNNKLLMTCLIKLNNHGKKIFNHYSDKKIATSKEAAMWMFNEYKDVFISINGIDIPKFIFSRKNRKKIRLKLNINNNTKLIGFVGVLQKRKNPLFALSIFAKYHKFNTNSKLLMLGKGPLKEQINRTIKELGIQDSVIQYDFISNINEWYSAMDALLFPSMYEGLSLVALESQISNLQVLASDSNVDDIFATHNIKKICGWNVDIWTANLKDSLSHSKSRDYLDESIKRFSIITQSKEIENLI